MAAHPFLSLILPAYNEAGTIRHTLTLAQSYLDRQGYPYEVIVAADGTDGTRELVAEVARADARVSVLGGPQRRGKGHGIRQAVARARGQIIGFVDADNKTPIEELDKVLPGFYQGYDLVIGSRAMPETHIEVAQPVYRRLGSWLFGQVVRRVVGLRGIRDTQCGFKFFRGPVAKDLFGRQRVDGYMFDVEVLHLAVRGGYRIQEVGVRWRDDGDSRLELVAGNWRNMRDILRIRLGGLSRCGVVPREAPRVPGRQKAA
jgi:dolichyl-phosphate beta-glucosyltransferase